MSLLILGALFGSLFGGNIADTIGRKKTFFLSLIILFISTFTFILSKNIYLLFFSRSIIGISVGIFSTIVPIYIAEISDPKFRGRLAFVHRLLLVAGILSSNICGFHFSKTQNWQSIFLVGLIFALIMFILLFFIPETPGFLELKKTRLLKKTSLPWSDLLKRNIRSALIVGIGINVIKQFSGINIVTYYAPKIFQTAGFLTPDKAIFATILVTSVNFTTSFISFWLIDFLGRKPLLIISSSGMLFSLLTLSWVFFYLPGNLPIIVIICFMCFTGSFGMGLGCINWLINSEIYPLEARGKAVGIATLFNWICNYLVSISFLTLINTLGNTKTFLLYAALCLLGLVFIIKKVPETKGKSLLEIQDFFKIPN